MTMIRVTQFLSVVSLVGPLLCGCSGEVGPICYPVRGVVTLDGKPVAEAMIVFHPQGEQLTPTAKPVARSDSEGKFALTTVTPGDGASPGDYAITIVLRAERLIGEELVRDGRNLLPLRYSDPEKSGLNYTVVAGPNETPTLKLTAR